MEKEIDLGRLFAILWKGKYVIIGLTMAAALTAALYSYLFIRPIYRAEAQINIRPLNVSSEALVQMAKSAAHNQLLIDAVIDLIENPENLILIPNDTTVIIQVLDHDPENASLAANKAGEALIDFAIMRFDFGKTALRREMRRLERSLRVFDEELEAFYDEISSSNNESLNFLNDDAGFAMLGTLRAELLAEMLDIRIQLRELDGVKEMDPHELLVVGTAPLKPINVNWQVNSILAALAGLMVSVFIVLIRFFTAQSFNAKRLDANID